MKKRTARHEKLSKPSSSMPTTVEGKRPLVEEQHLAPSMRMLHPNLKNKISIPDVMRLQRTLGNHTTTALLNSVRQPHHPTPARIQRTILADIDPKITKPFKEGKYSRSHDFIQEYEIYESAQILAEKYKMTIHNIREPKPGKLAHSEALILVGHGGQGQFMNMDEGEFVQLVTAWGLKEGMTVVLAGCNTSQAKAVITFLRDATGKDPIVNNDLAYTDAQTGEFTIDENLSFTMYKERNKELDNLDKRYLAQHNEVIKSLPGNIDQTNFDEKWAFVNKLMGTLNPNKEFLKGFPPFNEHFKGEYRNKPQLLIGLWNSIVDNMFKFELGSTGTKTSLDKLNNLHSYLSAIPDAQEAFLKRHQEIIDQTLETAKQINREFIQQLQAKFPVKYINYTAKAFKNGGQLPPVARLVYQLRKKVQNPPVQGPTISSDLNLQILLETIAALEATVYQDFKNALKAPDQ